MTFREMMPIDKIRPTMPRDAPAGSLLIPYSDEDGLQLRFDSGDSRLGLYLSRHHRRGFHAALIDGRHHPALCLTGWSVRVDVSTAYNTFDGTPSVGDAFFAQSGSVFGFIGEYDHTTRYITTEGEMIREPRWHEDLYIGFRRWSVGYESDGKLIDLLPLEDVG